MEIIPSVLIYTVPLGLMVAGAYWFLPDRSRKRINKWFYIEE